MNVVIWILLYVLKPILAFGLTYAGSVALTQAISKKRVGLALVFGWAITVALLL